MSNINLAFKQENIRLPTREDNYNYLSIMGKIDNPHPLKEYGCKS